MSEANLKIICDNIEGLYQTNSRAMMTEVLTNTVLSTCISSMKIPERLIMEIILLLSVTHANVGTELGMYQYDF